MPDGEVGKIAGDTGFYAELFVIALDLVLGVIFDTVGRKIPTVVGLLLCGVSIILTPYCHRIYPEYLILRIFMSLGIIPGVNTPLAPDYVQEQSLGLANAYVSHHHFPNDVCIVKCSGSVGYNICIYRFDLSLKVSGLQVDIHPCRCLHSTHCSSHDIWY